MITMRKSTHGFPFVSHIWVAYGAPLGGPLGRRSSATSSTDPGGFALLAGDASVDFWFREIHVPAAWHVYLTTGFDFPEKIVLILSRSELEFAVSLLPCHFTVKER